MNKVRILSVALLISLLVLAGVLGFGHFGKKIDKVQEPVEESDENQEEVEDSGIKIDQYGIKQSKKVDSEGQIESEPESESEPKLSEEEQLEQQVKEKLGQMTIEQKVAQLFIITPEALTGYETVTQAGETTRIALLQYPIGGLIYFENNLISKEQVTEMIALQQQDTMEAVGLPLFISIDEEGGKVARIASESKASFGVPVFSNMSEIGATGDSQKAYDVGSTIGTYLHRMGFNLDFAPVADVLTNPENTVVKERSFGSDPTVVSEMVSQVLTGLEEQQVYGCIKHFPGHGATLGDTHNGYAYTDKTWEELCQSEVIPFQNSIEQGVFFIMIGHISLPQITGDDTPASLSEVMIQNYLQGELGYEGIVLTDALNMKAVTNQYTSAQAAVKAVNAGVDMLLMPADFQTAYEGIIEAVQNGTITEERLNQSIRKILKIKLSM